jgi:dipeptidyl-peptidase-4
MFRAARCPFGVRVRLVAVLLVVLPLLLAAQQKTLTLDDLYDPERKIDFTGTVLTGLSWIDDSTYSWIRNENDKTQELLKVDALTGRSTSLYEVAKLEKALASLPGLAADDAKRLARPPAFTFDEARRRMVLNVAGDLYSYEIAADRVTRLTDDPAEEEDPAFSPDGRMLAFTRRGNLYALEIASGRARQLTTDGSKEVLNGRLDWVYQEEIYGRGKYRAFWWSPDSARIAFLQLRETTVPKSTIVDHVPILPALEIYSYPRAGNPNPTVKLGIVRAAGGPVTWCDTFKYSAQDHLIVDVSWTADGRQLVHQVQDREQTWLDLNLADASSGAARTVLRETTKAWVDHNGPPVWLKNGTFLWLSERSGWQHLYHYKADGGIIRQITDGPWEARTLYGVDETNGWIYFGGTERSPIGNDIYRVKLDGSELKRLSKPGGTHEATFNPSLSLYVGSWSDATTPTQTRLHNADGTELRAIERNSVQALAQFQLSQPEFLQVTTRDGFVMEAMILKPPGFDPSRKYPVLQHVYAGPHAQTVRNVWGGTTGMYWQLLAQKGIIVWMCDNRSASGKGAQSAWPVYQRLGQTELADIEDGVAWLRRQPWVDGERIGINGWSYGGYMAAYALTHSRSFAMGISGAPVTDWALYDSVYTERFMRLPQNNPAGYRAASVVSAAGNLSGRLLLIHGTIDDNVHVQNSVQLAYALQQAGKPFEMMMYPKSRHALSDPRLVWHLRSAMLDFTLRTLRPSDAPEHSTSR